MANTLQLNCNLAMLDTIVYPGHLTIGQPYYLALSLVTYYPEVFGGSVQIK